MKLLAFGLLALAGCVTPDLTRMGTVEQESGERCPPSICGNSPEVAHHGLWEASIRGAADTHGYSIRSLGGRAYLTKGTTQYSIQVIDGRLFGINKLVGTLSGTGLVGAEIELMQGSAPLYTIYIAGVNPAGAHFVVGDRSPIETYRLLWHEPGASPSSGKQLCNSPLTASRAEDLLGMHTEDTLLFEGDRVALAGMTMSQTADPSWFNFGCAGHTLAKLRLTRNTIAGQPQPDWAQRQATLKMLVADYCGTGRAFTLAGAPLVWKGGFQPDYPATAILGRLDARWTEKGAACLGEEPRMLNSLLPDASVDFPDVVKQIRDECPALQPCRDQDVQVMDGALVVSANRVP